MPRLIITATRPIIVPSILRSLISLGAPGAERCAGTAVYESTRLGRGKFHEFHGVQEHAVRSEYRPRNATKSNRLAGLRIRGIHRPQLMPYHYRNRILEQIHFEDSYEL